MSARVRGVAVLAALALPLGAVPSASAEEPTRVQAQAGTPSTKVRLDTQDLEPGNGYARVSARIVWRSARTAVVRGHVDDVCPNNGQSALMVLTAEFRGGAVRQWRKEDARDCSAGGLRFQKKFSGESRLRNVTVLIAEKSSSGRFFGRDRTSWNKR